MSSNTPVKIFYLKNKNVSKGIFSSTLTGNHLIRDQKIGSMFLSDQQQYNKKQKSSITHLSTVLQYQKKKPDNQFDNFHFFSTEMIKQQQTIFPQKNQNKNFFNNGCHLNEQDIQLLSYCDWQSTNKNQVSEKQFYSQTIEAKKNDVRNLAFMIKNKWNDHKMQKQMRKTQKNIKRTLQLSHEKIKSDQIMLSQFVNKYHSKSQTKQLLKHQFFDFINTKIDSIKQKQKKTLAQRKKNLSLKQAIFISKKQSFDLTSNNKQCPYKKSRVLHSTTFFDRDQPDNIQQKLKRQHTNLKSQNLRSTKKNKKLKQFLTSANKQQQTQKKWWSVTQPKSKFFQLRRTLIH